jgi:DNA-binding PadR family transcriptional regulator
MKRRRKFRGPFWEAWHARFDDERAAPRETARAWQEHLQNFLGEAPEHHWFFGGRRFKGAPWGPQGFNPMVGMFLSKGGGMLPLYVLHLLSQQSRYGNEIMNEIEIRTEGRWSTNPGAIYPLLDMFEQQGLVESEWEDPTKRTRRFYRLTDTGQAELNRLKEVMRPKLEEVIVILGRLLKDLYAE